FSSRRRHTRFSRDWSSDVCSSDLEKKTIHYSLFAIRYSLLANAALISATPSSLAHSAGPAMAPISQPRGSTSKVVGSPKPSPMRSEERRVGKESRPEGSPEERI